MIELATPGKICLTSEIIQQQLWSLALRVTTQGDHEILTLDADDIDLDMRGNRILNRLEYGVVMIGAATRLEKNSDPSRVPRTLYPPTRRAHIHNGTIHSPFRSGIGIRLTNMGSHQRPDYPTTQNIIESMTIQAGMLAIRTRGGGNTIRKSRIIVDSALAIDAWGPGTVIEDNVIEIRSTAFPDYPVWPKELPPSTTPLRLLDADGAIIRNNVIRFTGPIGDRPLPAAIGLTKSRNVTIENNQFIGFNRGVQADADSSVTESGNQLVQ